MKKWLRLTIVLITLLAVAVSVYSQENEDQWIEILGKADATQHDKARACQQLALYGSGKCVPALAALLKDEFLGVYARYGLEPIKDPAVDKALREAIDKVQGKLLAGVINSIGVRRDPAAVDSLISLTSDPSPEVADAAIGALGQIATDHAIEKLESILKSGKEPLLSTAVDACLNSADRLIINNRKQDAIKLYEAVRKSNAPEHLLSAATYSLIRTQGVDALSLLIDQLKSGNPAMTAVALRAIREIRGEDVSRALASELKKLTPDVQTLLIKALVDRNDPTVCKGIEKLVKSKDDGVRQEALGALGKIGNVDSVAILVKAAEGDDADIALASLRILQSDGVDSDIITGMKKSESKLKAKLIDILADRHCSAASPALIIEAASEDQTVARAAFKALSTLAGPDDTSALVELLVNLKDDSIRNSSENAVASAALKINDTNKRADAVLSRLNAIDNNSARCSLLRVLGRIANKQAFDAVVNAVGDKDESIKDAAIRAMADWPDASALEPLLNILKSTDNDLHRTLALRGAVRLAGQASEEPQNNIESFIRLTEFAKRPDDKKLVLSGLADIPHPEALKMAVNELADEKVRSEAALAVIKIARNISGHNPGPTREAMDRILKEVPDNGVKEMARTVLRGMDEAQSFLTAWEACGPFEKDGAAYSQLFDVVFEPETNASATSLKWKPIASGTTAGKPWLIDVLKFYGGEQKVAYLRTWIFSPEEQPARMELGSDDGVKVWLGNKMIHANNAARAAVPGNDKKDIDVPKGWTPLLVKLTQNNLGWELVVKICGRDGNALPNFRSSINPDR